MVSGTFHKSNKMPKQVKFCTLQAELVCSGAALPDSEIAGAVLKLYIGAVLLCQTADLFRATKSDRIEGEVIHRLDCTVILL